MRKKKDAPPEPQRQLLDETLIKEDKLQLPSRQGHPRNIFPNGFGSYLYKLKLEDDEIIFRPGIKSFRIDFAKHINSSYGSVYDIFQCNKNSYINNIVNICDDLNAFCALYDPDEEVVIALFRLKYIIDSGKYDDEIKNLSYFKKLIYDTIATPTIIAKIRLFVQENYAHDIYSDSYSPGITKKRDILEFTNDQIKNILCCAYMIKIIGIILSHYLVFMGMKQATDYIANVYLDTFKLFDDGSIHNKTLAYIESKAIDSYKHNQLIYTQNEILGDDTAIIAYDLYIRYIVVDSFIKFRHHTTWNKKLNRPVESVLSFYRVIPMYHLDIYLKQIFRFNIMEMRCDPTEETQRRLERVKANMIRNSEGNMELISQIVQSDYDIFCQENSIYYSPEEVAYFEKHTSINQINIVLLQLYLNNKYVTCLNQHQIITLLVIISNKLLKQYKLNSLSTFEDFPVLPFILTAKSGRVVEGNMFSVKDVEKLVNNIIYKTNMSNRFSALSSVSPTIISDLVLMIINGTYTYVSYSRQEYTGKPIPIYKDVIVKEIIHFVLG